MLNNHLNKVSVLLFLGLIFSSCNAQKNKLNLSLNKPFDETPLSFLAQTDTLKLTAMFSECGEFGGFKEEFTIHKNYKKEYFAKYTRDTINIDCPPDFEDKRVFVKDTTFKMSNSQVMLVRKYLKKLFKGAIGPVYLEHANDYYSVYTLSGSLSFRLVDHKKNWSEYKKLRNKLTQ